MAGRPTDWDVLDLDRDPVPGDPYEVKELARKLGDFADDVASALRSVRGLNGDTVVQEWAGLSGDAYRQQFGDLPGELDKLERSYRLASGALDGYWPKLETAQGDADRALAQGRTARQELDGAKSQLTNADAWVKRAQDKSKTYQDDPKPNVPPPSADEVRAASRNATDANSAHTTASTAVHNAQAKLDAAKQLAADAAQLRDDAASTAQHALHEASDAGIKNKHWWEKAVDWVADHWDDIIAVCKVIVAVLGIVVLIIGGPLAWLVLAAAILVLADTVMKYLKGQASLWDVLFAALDCIPMFKGLTTAGGLLKMARELPALLKSGKALENIANSVRKVGEGLKGLKDALPSLRKGAQDEVKVGKPMEFRCKGGDPVDLVTGEMLMSQTDVELPGLLPLVVERNHVSTYRSGHWFGPSWASTLDERLEVDAEGIVCAADDGMLQVYPVPSGDGPTIPTQGPRRQLSWDGTPGGEILVTDPETGRTRHYAPLPIDPGESRVLLPLRAISDRNGHRITIERDAQGIPTAIRHTGGYLIGIDTDGDHVTALRLLNGDEPGGTVLRRYAYDDRGNLAEVVDSTGAPLRLDYDDSHRVVQWTDVNAAWYRFTYDDRDRCVAGEGADGILNCLLAYDGDARTTTYTDSLSRQTVHRHNELLQRTSYTDPRGATTRFEWDHHGRLLARTDPLGRETRFSYDDASQTAPSTIVHPDGATATATYNGLGQPVAVTDPGGSVWRHAYDERGNLTSVVDPTGAETRYVHDTAGRVEAVTDALGFTEHITTNAVGLVLAVSDALGRITSVERDAFGRIVATTDALGVRSEQRWTTEGKLSSRAVPGEGEETWDWDAEGNLLAWTDPAGRGTSYTYGPFDLAASRTDPDGARYEFSYDTELRLTAVTNPQGLSWRYELDAAGRMVAETDFNGRVVAYEYDGAGQLAARTNGAGQRVRFGRDLLGRITEQEVDDGPRTTFAYSPSGHVVAATNSHTHVALERDKLGRLLREVTNGRAVGNQYDAMGRRVQRRTPSGAVSAWTYDAAGRATGLACDEGRLDFAYDAAGRETLRRLGPAVTLTQEWDAGSRLTAMDVTAGREADTAAVLGRRYTYGCGAVTEIDDLHDGSRRFTVDALDRVTKVTAANWQESYAYDAAGNVVRSALGDGSDESRTAVGTLVHSAGRHHYSYDGQGRLVRHDLRLLNGQRRTWTYSWDAEDRLTAVVTPDGSHWRYLYDPFGRRIAKERSDAEGEVLERADFAWDGTRVAEESSGGQHTTWEYAPDSHRPLAQVTTQDEYDRRFYAIVTDLAGAPTELLDASGDVAWRMRTTLWGSGTPTGGATCPLRFQGQYYDAESGLHYNLERFYDPALGRYVSPDPLGLDAAPNHHAYVPNPLLWTDPLGLAPACGGAGADNAANYAKQQRYYEQAQKYGKGGVRELESGRFRFYGTIAEARNPGEMVGRRLVREWDPATDATRIWHETVDHAGNVRIVRPDVKVTGGEKVHYVFDALGNFTGTF